MSRAISSSWPAQLGRGEKRHRLFDRHRGDLGDRFAVEANVEAFLLQPRAVALRTRPHVHVRLQHLADALGVGLLVAAVEPGQHAFERAFVAAAMLAALVGERDLFVARAVENRAAHFGRDVLPRRVEAELVVRRQRLEHRLHVVHRGPGRDRAVGDAEVFVLHHQLGIEIHDRADARAGRARPVRAVEREHPRRDLGIRDAALHAGEALAEIDLARVLAVEPFNLEQVVAVLEGNFQRVAQALLDSAADREAVDDHLDGVAEILIERDFFAQFAHRAVDLDPHEAGAPQIAQLLAILALAVAHDRREHVNPRALGPRHDAVDDLLHALLRDLAPAVVAERMADAREQQAQVIIDLGDGGDGRARIARGRLLLDRNRRRESLDRIDVRLLHLLQELARVGRERLDVAPLAFGVNRVEGERRLART